MKNYKNIFLIICLVLLIVLGLQIIEPAIGNTITNLLTTLTTIVGFISVFYEMKRSADIDECNFILETFKHFTADANSGISIIYEKLDDIYSGKENRITENDRKHMVQYLQFFEMIANLIEKDSISISDIDRLYGYAFFIATNCPDVQKMELIPAKDYYEGIMSIYPIWKKYRESHNKPIPFNKTPLLK